MGNYGGHTNSATSGRVSGVSVTWTPTGRAAVERTLGHSLSDAQVARLVGAPAGTSVTVKDLASLTDRGFELALSGANVRSRVHFMQERDYASDDRNARYLKMDFYVMDVAHATHGQGTATRAFTSMVNAARRLGVKLITADISRHDDQNIVGYKVWPRLGFNAELRRSMIEQLPPALSGARDLLDLYETPTGRAWWAEHGRSIDAEFDLTAGSRSMRTLQRYVRERRQRGAKKG